MAEQTYITKDEIVEMKKAFSSLRSYVNRLVEENNAMKEMLIGFLNDEGFSGKEDYYCGIGLWTIKEIEDIVHDKVDKNYGIKYILNGVDKINEKEFVNYECYGCTLREIALLHQDDHEKREDWESMYYTGDAIEYLFSHGFDIEEVRLSL